MLSANIFDHVFNEEIGSVGSLLRGSEVCQIGVNQVQVKSPPLPGPSGKITLSVFAQNETIGKASLGGILAHYRVIK